ncbi:MULTISPECIES: hypothetical protein [Pseudonocardia]|uniref:hypothetical protein n=1 Tax=Pseudonocardia TaxID=1847 RepID=UPI0013028C65|nr:MULTISPECIES: hypothetical protein [Pseudonocardia]
MSGLDEIEERARRRMIDLVRDDPPAGSPADPGAVCAARGAAVRPAGRVRSGPA